MRTVTEKQMTQRVSSRLTSIIVFLLAALSLSTLVYTASLTLSSTNAPLSNEQLYLPFISKPPKLASAAAAHGIKIGVAFHPSRSTSASANTARAYFNSITPEVVMKMQWIHPCPPDWLLYGDEDDPNDTGYAEIRTWLASYSGIPNQDPEFIRNCKTYPMARDDPEAPKKREWNWEPMDSLVAWANANNIKIYGHALVWHSQNPGWLTHSSILFPEVGRYVISEEDLSRLMREHIEAVVGRYCAPFEYNGQMIDPRGLFYAYDVVNEAISRDGNLEAGSIHGEQAFKRFNPWHIIGNENNVEGDNYVRRAFEYTKQALNDHCEGQNIELFYNDFGFEYGYQLEELNNKNSNLMASEFEYAYTAQEGEKKFNRIYNLVAALQTPLPSSDSDLYPLVDGIGVQAHLTNLAELNSSQHTNFGGTTQWVTTMAQFADLGLDIKVTELDVSLARLYSATPTPPPAGTATATPRNLPPCPDPANNIHLRHGSSWRCNLPLSPIPSYYSGQAETFAQIAEACLQLNYLDKPGKCTGFTTWGLNDENSWIKCFRPLMFEKNTPIPCSAAHAATPAAPTRPPTPTRTPRPPRLIRTPAPCKCRARFCLDICQSSKLRRAQPDFLLRKTSLIFPPPEVGQGVLLELLLKKTTQKRFISTATPLPRFTPKAAFDAVYDTFSNPPTPIGAARNYQADTILANQAYPAPLRLRAPSSYP